MTTSPIQEFNPFAEYGPNPLSEPLINPVKETAKKINEVTIQGNCCEKSRRQIKLEKLVDIRKVTSIDYMLCQCTTYQLNLIYLNKSKTFQYCHDFNSRNKDYTLLRNFLEKQDRPASSPENQKMT